MTNVNLGQKPGPAFRSLLYNQTTEEAKAAMKAERELDIQKTLFSQEKLLVAEEMLKLDGVTEDQLAGIVIQSSRGVTDDIILKSIGITDEQLRAIRSSTRYKKLLADKSINIVNNNLSADITRDKIELKALNMLLARMNEPGHTLENMEVLAISRAMNQAKRRYGADSQTQSFAPQGNGNLNVTQNIVNVAIPSVVLHRLKQLNSGAIQIRSDDQYIEQYGSGSANEIDVKRVSHVLGVDLSKPNGREATISETYNHMFETVPDTADGSSILEGEG